MFIMQSRKFVGKVHEKLRAQSGFSLVEILIATLMLGIVSTAAFSFYQNQHEQYIRQTDVADIQQSVRVAMQELTNQVRRAGYRVFGQPAVEISPKGDTLLVRYSNGGAVHTQLFYVASFDRDKDNHLEYELMTQIDGGLPQTFAENIDRIRFVGGGTGGGIEWVDIALRGHLARSGLHTNSDGVYQATDIGRILTSRVKLRNR